MQQYPYAQTAQGLASLGRGEDTMLMHITPEEFQDFNRMAQSAGYEHIPINPQTGLPEFGIGKAFKSVAKVVSSAVKSVANVVSNPIVAPIVGAALTIASGGAITPFYSGLITGGITTLGTGSLSQGIMSGFGAYGGANLGNAFYKQGLASLGNSGLAGAGGYDAAAAAYNAGPGSQLASQGMGLGGMQTAAGAAGGAGSSILGNFQTAGQGLGDLFNNPQGIGVGFDNFKDALGTTTEAVPAKVLTTDAAGNALTYSAAIPAGVTPASTLSAAGALISPVAGPLLTAMAEPLPVEELPTEPTEEPYVYEPLYLSNSANNLQLYGPEYTGYGREQWEKTPSSVNAAGGGYLSGGGIKSLGDGMSDEIPATIDGKQEARLSDGEFVIPADVVSHLGNGSSNAGAKNLYAMMDRIRQARTGNKKQGKEINIGNYMPA